MPDYKIALGVPRGGNPRYLVAEHSIQAMINRLASEGGLTKYLESISCRVDLNRKHICREFLDETDADYLFMADDDMVFHPQTPEILAFKLDGFRKHVDPKAGVMCGVYFQRGKHCQPHVYRKDVESFAGGEWGIGQKWMTDETLYFYRKYAQEQGDGPFILEDIQIPSVMPVDSAGTGCILIHREVLEGTPEPWWRVMGRTPEEAGNTAGDLAFFYRAKAAGFNSYVDMAVVAGHMTEMPIGVHTYLTGQVQNQPMRQSISYFLASDEAPNVDVVIASAYPERAAKEAVHIKEHGGTLIKQIIVGMGPYEDGVIKKVNAGLKGVTAPYTLILNDDIRLKGACLETMLLAITADETIGAVGPTYPCRSHQGWKSSDPQNVDAPWLSTGALLMRSRLLAEVGLLDEQFIAYADDPDFGLRIRDGGYRCVWVQEAEAEHTIGPYVERFWHGDHRRFAEKWPDRLDELQFDPRPLNPTATWEHLSQKTPLKELHPLTDSWQIGERALTEIEKLVQEVDAKKLLEIGSGMSTVRLAYECPDLKIDSIEHDPEWAETVSDLLKTYKLDDRAVVHLTPLKNGRYTLNGKLGQYDIVVVDGPPYEGQKARAAGRMAVLNKAHQSIGVGGAIVVNNVKAGAADRVGAVCVEKFLAKYGTFYSHETVDTRHDLAILRRVQ